MSSVKPLKDDVVCYTDNETRRIFMGAVSRSRYCPEPSDTPESEDYPSEPVGPQATEPIVPDSPCTNPSKNQPEVYVDWMSLASGDDYTPDESPIPTVLQANQLTVWERDHLLADVVTHSQRGLVGSVVACRLRAFVELLSYGRVMFDVDCSRLRSVSPWSSRTSENRVVWRGWLGRVMSHRSLAIVRFADGARMLVQEQDLRDFDPIPPTSDAFPDPLFEGAWLRGDAFNLRHGFESIHLGKPSKTHWGVPSSSTAAAAHRSYQSHHVTSANPSSTGADPPNLDANMYPSKLLDQLRRYPVTRSLLQQHPDGLVRCLQCLPLFLHETKHRNALWLSRLRRSATVSVFVESVIPIEATVHWLACREPTVEGVAPPNVIRGDDLANLKPVHSAPYLFATGRDIWYLQLNESDIVYNLKAYTCPEELLYDWVTRNEANLRAVSMPTCSASETTDALGTAWQDPIAVESLNTRKTTSVWVQRALLHSLRRRHRHRCRVLASSTQRLRATERNRLTDELASRFQIYITDDDDDDSDAQDRDHGRLHSKSKTPRNDPSVVDASTEISAEKLADANDAAVPSAASLSADRLLHIRESHLPPLCPGTWVAVGIYSTQTECDVRWLDGTLERGIRCADLEPLYFNMDEHEFFPGTFVCLKTAGTQQSPTHAPCSNNPTVETSDQLISSDPTTPSPVSTGDTLPRDYGLVLSVSTKDRTCLVQWFRTEQSEYLECPHLHPAGKPEEVGVYELRAPAAKQIVYGSLVWVHSSAHPRGLSSVALVTDIMPEPGKVALQWDDDGTPVLVERTKCLNAVDSLHESDQWSSDDSDEPVTDQLTSDFDSDWESLSELSDSVVAGDQATNALPTTESSEDRTEKELSENAMREAVQVVKQAAARLDAVHRLFESHHFYAHFLLSRFTPIPAPLNQLFNQMASLVGPAARAISASSPEPRTAALVLVNPRLVAMEREPPPAPPIGQFVFPSPDLDQSERGELMSLVGKMLSVRDSLRQAYELVHDYRIKKMFHLCDPRHIYSEEFVEHMLQSINLTPFVSCGAELSTNESDADPSGQECEQSKTQEDSPPYRPTMMDLNVLACVELVRMKVLVIPEALESLGDSEDRWRKRVRSCLGVEHLRGWHDPYVIMSTTMFTKLAHYVATTHQHLLEQLTDFKDRVRAWLGEVCPHLLVDPTPDKIREASAPLATNELDLEAPEQPKPEPDTATTDPRIEEPTCPEGSNEPYGDTPSTVFVDAIPLAQRGEFVVDDTAPFTHWFYTKAPKDLSRSFHKAWRRDTMLLSTSLPRGVFVKSFSDLISLFSVMIVGPSGTPYEHNLFLFDILLPADYPTLPPQAHYYSFTAERINPNLYVDGNVCLSLLGTWAGKGTENWDPDKSSLLQLIVSIQGLILNAEPYFNEAGFEMARGTSDAIERSRVYNESVIATLVESAINMLRRPPPLFQQEIRQHFTRCAQAYASALEFWASLDSSEVAQLKKTNRPETEGPSSAQRARQLPDFPLAPVTKGFQISVRRNRLVFLELIAANQSNDHDHAT